VEPNVADLATAHPVYTLDSLGEPGRSVQSLPIRNGADAAGWLDEALEALGLRRVHLAGASAGAAMAFNQAVHRPARVASVTLLDPAQVLARFSAKFLLAGTFTALPGVPAAAPDWFLSWVSGGAAMDTPIFRLLASGIREYQIRLPMPGYASDEVLRSVQMPVLALLGGRSVVHDPQRAAERARTLLPRGEAEVWPAASHAISGDAAARVNDRILRFVAATAA
jgi:pimeloyl-ACP methyl ester carboxylesterase